MVSDDLRSTRARIRVNFNECVAENLVPLSRDDQIADSTGAIATLVPGMRVYLYDPDDCDEAGNPTDILATGLVELNAVGGWSQHVKWLCRIDAWA